MDAGCSLGDEWPPGGRCRVAGLGPLPARICKEQAVPGRLTTPLSLAQQAPAVCVLRRSPEGAPVQIFVPENGEIVSQV